LPRAVVLPRALDLACAARFPFGAVVRRLVVALRLAAPRDAADFFDFPDALPAMRSPFHRDGFKLTRRRSDEIGEKTTTLHFVRGRIRAA
jgi:hypothetical protein